MSDAKIRLHLDRPFGEGQPLTLGEAQAHYLFGVMRLAAGARVLVFNGRDGEWLAEVEEAGKRKGLLRCIERVRDQEAPPDLWLLFAPLKKARTDFVVEKAVELGAARILPVQTEFTNAERVRQDRLQAHATEAAEQCGATWVPEVAELERLDRVLAGWPEGRRLYYCDEGEAGSSASLAPLLEPAREASGLSAEAILVGPEGGFSETERARLRALPFVTVLPLGPRILRAETAAVAALALWQAARGDWR